MTRWPASIFASTAGFGVAATVGLHVALSTPTVAVHTAAGHPVLDVQIPDVALVGATVFACSGILLVYTILGIITMAPKPQTTRRESYRPTRTTASLRYSRGDR